MTVKERDKCEILSHTIHFLFHLTVLYSPISRPKLWICIFKINNHFSMSLADPGKTLLVATKSCQAET